MVQQSRQSHRNHHRRKCQDSKYRNRDRKKYGEKTWTSGAGMEEHQAVADQEEMAVHRLLEEKVVVEEEVVAGIGKTFSDIFTSYPSVFYALLFGFGVE